MVYRVTRSIVLVTVRAIEDPRAVALLLTNYEEVQGDGGVGARRGEAKPAKWSDRNVRKATQLSEAESRAQS